MRSAEWATERARAVAMRRTDVIATCGKRYRSVACGCSRYEFKVGCDQPTLCGPCRKKHAAKWWRRIANGMANALWHERTEWRQTPAHRRRGMVPGIYLITLTGPHSGDMVTDRKNLGDAVRKLLKHATKHGWWRTYALTWEATGGTRGDGHVHCHLAVVSSWVPYTGSTEEWAPRRKGERRPRVRGLHEVWQDAMPGAIQPDVSPPKRDCDQAQSAGHYLAKYVTKGVDPEEFSGAKAGELLAAFRNQRKVSTSAGFWQDKDAQCDCCGKGYRSVEVPCSLQDIAPAAVLRSLVTRHLWLGVQESFAPWVTRGSGGNLHAPVKPQRERALKANKPSRWTLTKGPDQWAEKVSLQGWTAQHFEKTN
jgi:hypothetical protein